MQNVFDEIKEGIESVTGDEQLRVDLKNTSIYLYEINQFLETLGFEFYEVETNGWDLDYWYTFFRDDIEVIFSGSVGNGRRSVLIQRNVR